MTRPRPLHGPGAHPLIRLADELSPRIAALPPEERAAAIVHETVALLAQGRASPAVAETIRLALAERHVPRPRRLPRRPA